MSENSAIPEHIRSNIQRMVQAQYEAEGAPFVELGRAIKERVDQQDSRMTALEQEVVAARGGSIGTSNARTGQALGSALRAAIEGDTAYQHLAAWNQGTARLTMDGLSIRSALVNEPYDPAPTSNTSMPSQPERMGLVGPLIAQPRLLNFLRSRPVGADSVEYVQMSTTGDAGYQEGEGAQKPVIEIQGDLRRNYIATIAATTTASRQVLSDHSALRGLVDGILRQKLINRLSTEIINGQAETGDTLHIAGLLKQGAAMTLPTSTGYADRIGEATVRQSNLGFRPALIVCNPLDWFTKVSTAKTETEKTYLFGSPTSPVSPALWSLPVALEPSLPQGYSMTIDLDYVTVLDRERISVLVSNSHEDYFTRNLVAILGELRAGLEVLDEGAVMIIEPSSN